eukprot:TRINITY_DN701_c0_g2_i14.p1 TRINITY_DN701_c0_g2~~TRINITY_DN701_c0_g2_i14.p1  ORF type:complete len:623 (-),score=95.56 TRINITY_DN701_c0_g2_i14:340-2208(-)
MRHFYCFLLLATIALQNGYYAVDCPAGCIDEQPPNQPHSCQTLAQDFDACGSRVTRGDRYCKCSCYTCPGQSGPPSSPLPALAQEGWVFIESTQQSQSAPAPQVASMESLPTVQNRTQIASQFRQPVALPMFSKPIASVSFAPVSSGTVVQNNLDTIGLAVGGARGIDTFRRSVENGQLPSSSDLTYEGIFNDYFFDITDDKRCTQLFCAKYSGSITSDPLFPSTKKDFYLGIGLESGQKAATFKRKDLDLVVVLDVSGSMGEKFGQYDGSSSKDLTKIDVAKQAIKNMMKHLTPSDKMAVVTFAISAKVQVDLEFVTPRFVSVAGSKVDSIGVGGKTNLEDGLNVAAGLMQRDIRENRLIVITDANANSGEYSEQGLATIISDLANAADPIYTSLIGVGLDFNSDLTNAILKTKGANYFTVYSPEELSKKLDEEFDYMVSPFLFDLELEFDLDSLNGADGWKILQAFGVPADAAGVQSSGQILKVSTLFPSPKTAEGTKGGIILLQLKRTDNPKPLYIKVSYMDQDFWLYAGSSEVQLFKDPNVEFYGSDAIRKAILLSRYVDVLKFWLDGVSGNQLVVSKESADDFIAFLAYMNEQKEILKDSRLDREITLLKKLISLGI